MAQVNDLPEVALRAAKDQRLVNQMITIYHTKLLPEMLFFGAKFTQN
jgi:hypothetical protein